ncbi:MAG: ABC transporter ATP-binding protein [Microbacteriaceae bacterium]
MTNTTKEVTTKTGHMATNVILSLQNLTKHYGSNIALDGIDLDIKAGEFLTLLGPSGSGKTTTLNLIAGFVEPTAGSMYMDGGHLEKVPAYKRNLGLVFQHYALFPHMTVWENIEFPLKERKIDKATRTKTVEDILEMVQLSKFKDRLPKQLSGGQQQRVALARAVVFRPPILLMDEPLGALDKKLREWLQLELRRIHRELQSTFIYVTHDQEEALVLSDRIAVFNEGKIEQVGTSRELYDQPQTLFVGRFIGESTIFEGKIGSSSADGVQFETTKGHTFESINQRNLSGKSAILLRPEKMKIHAENEAPKAGHNTIAGKIIDAVYLGSAMKYNVETDEGEAVVRVTDISNHALFAIGDNVVVSWSKEDSVLVTA